MILERARVPERILERDFGRFQVRSQSWKPPTVAMPSSSPRPAPTPHAAGGMFSRPHIGLVAEQRPEAIIPLKKASGAFGPSITVTAPITIMPWRTSEPIWAQSLPRTPARLHGRISMCSPSNSNSRQLCDKAQRKDRSGSVSRGGAMPLLNSPADSAKARGKFSSYVSASVTPNAPAKPERDLEAIPPLTDHSRSRD